MAGAHTGCVDTPVNGAVCRFERFLEARSGLRHAGPRSYLMDSAEKQKCHADEEGYQNTT